MAVLRGACMALLVLCAGSFLWATGGAFFRKVEAPTLRLRAIQTLGVIAFTANFAALWAQGSFSTSAGTVALGAYLASLAVFWWSIATHAAKPPSHAFSSDPPTHLVIDGPYRAIRHPFYTSYLLTWVAGPVATQRLSLLIPLGIMIALYWHAAHLEERKFSACALAADYARYRSRSGMFLPKLPLN